MPCSQCGLIVEHGVPQCPRCGAPFTWAAGVAPKRARRPAQKLAAVLIGVLVIAIVLSGTILAAMRLSGGASTATLLSFGPISHTTNTCVTRNQDIADREMYGAEIDVSLAVTNPGPSTSERVWLVVVPTGHMGPTGISVMNKSELRTTQPMESGIALQGPMLDPGQTVTLKVALFAEVNSLFDYEVYVSVTSNANSAAIEAAVAQSWTGLQAIVANC
jgi:hypothetical protein